jgi:hypothetical protein
MGQFGLPRRSGLCGNSPEFLGNETDTSCVSKLVLCLGTESTPASQPCQVEEIAGSVAIDVGLHLHGGEGRWGRARKLDVSIEIWVTQGDPSSCEFPAGSFHMKCPNVDLDRRDVCGVKENELALALISARGESHARELAPQGPGKSTCDLLKGGCVGGVEQVDILRESLAFKEGARQGGSSEEMEVWD